MPRIDLHLHSTWSDGTLTPDELVQRARKRGVSVMALCDHDTMDGVPAFLASCRKHSIRGIAGIELSAQYPKEMHILGYRLRPSDEAFERFLETIRRGRTERNEAMCARLRSLGVRITMEDLAEEAGGELIARPHMARVMVSKGYVPDAKTAFMRYIGSSSPAYVERYRPSPGECIGAIRCAGGVAVLAHPFHTADRVDEIRKILAGLKELGLWGVECLSSHHSAEQSFQLLSAAKDLGLYTTAGSDFHEEGVPDIGVDVSEDFLPWARLGVAL
ncbi:MAG TPA: phosphatase [Synergistaceae bacterium]|mgnify:CR=1 FL=1|jgi:hypothetical protein|nr:phosphatase [Synergistaceae bacterium]